VCFANVVYRRRFATKTEAETWAAQREQELGIAGYPLNTSTLADVYAALKLLPEGATLTECVRTRIASQPIQLEDASLSDALKVYLEDRRAAGMARRTLGNVKCQLRHLPQAWTVRTITGRDLVNWFAKQTFGPVTRGNYRRAMHAFFAWAIAAGYRADNPSDAVSVVNKPDRLPEILTPVEIEALFDAAEAKRPKLCAYLALAAFAGVRISELMRLDSSALNDEVHITAEVAQKRKSARYIPIEPNLRKWLTVYPVFGPVCPVRESARDRYMDEIRVKAEIVKWPRNCLRHSFGSYHLALHNDINATRAAMGHSTPDMLFEHYRRLVSKADAERVFAVVPQGQEGIMPEWKGGEGVRAAG